MTTYDLTGTVVVRRQREQRLFLTLEEALGTARNIARRQRGRCPVVIERRGEWIVVTWERRVRQDD